MPLCVVSMSCDAHLFFRGWGALSVTFGCIRCNSPLCTIVLAQGGRSGRLVDARRVTVEEQVWRNVVEKHCEEECEEE